jgi:hypothetical protein
MRLVFSRKKPTKVVYAISFAPKKARAVRGGTESARTSAQAAQRSFNPKGFASKPFGLNGWYNHKTPSVFVIIHFYLHARDVAMNTLDVGAAALNLN